MLNFEHEGLENWVSKNKIKRKELCSKNVVAVQYSMFL